MKIPEKLRGFVLDKNSGRPLPGVVVLAVAEQDEGATFPLGILASDTSGYISFDFSYLQGAKVLLVKHLWVYVLGDETTRLDIASRYQTDNAHLQFLLTADSKLAWQNHNSTHLPSVQNPDLIDWENSPYSFAMKSDTLLGEDGCETPLPARAAERDLRFYRVVRLSSIGGDDVVTTEQVTAVNLMNIQELALGESQSGWSLIGSSFAAASAIFPNKETKMKIGHGEVLEFRQRWFPRGHSLGQVVYSLPLAPCESVNLAVIDWSRRDTATRKDEVTVSESLLHSERRDRGIEDTLNAALGESQGGLSLLGGSSSAASATIPISGVPVNVAATGAIGGGISNSWGNRDVTGSSLQELHDLIQQATSVTRSLNSTVIIQSTQEENNVLQTRTVTNHNHCHALTMQYYEVVRNFKIVTKFVRKRPVILIPYALFPFSWQAALRFQTILEGVLLDEKLVDCFDALVRCYVTPDIYVSDSSEPEKLPAPVTKEKKIAWYEIHLQTTDWNFSQTWGQIWISAGKPDGTWVELYHKSSVDQGGTELTKGEFTTTITANGNQVLDPADIARVRVQWQESNGNDSWDFKGIKILYGVAGESTISTLIDRQGISPPEFTKSNKPALKFFDDSGNSPQEWIGSVTVPTPPATEGSPQIPQPTSKDKPAYSKQNDEYCIARLLTHLNANLGYYNSAIWMLQNAVERRLFLDAALANYPEIRYGLDDTPLAVSGNYVAFPYTDPQGNDEEEPAGTISATDIVSLPTRGLFVEAQLGHCSACEARDVTRFWQWEESPCEKPPTIEGITPGPKGQPEPVQPTTLPAPVVQIMQPPAAPDPVGLAAALNLLGTPNIFRDMSGMKELQELLSGLSSGAVDLAKAQQLANIVNQGTANRALGSGGGGGGSYQQQTPQDRYDNLQVAKEVANAAQSLGWDKDKTSDVTSDIVSGGGGDFLSSIRKMVEQEVLGAAGNQKGITCSSLTPCVNENVTFILTGAPGVANINWSGGDNPSTGVGPTFTTRFSTHGQKTVKALWTTDAGTISATASTTVKELSGAQWVGQFPGSKSTAELTPSFRAKVNRFIAALTAAGAPPDINQTFRPQKRAYLMYYAQRIASSSSAPADVPPFDPALVDANDPFKGDINICWLHHDANGNPDLPASRAAAAAMVAGYHMAHPPAFPTNHSNRTAIDMDINWTGSLVIDDANGNSVTINSTPRTGAGNAELHAVGATYGVYKLVGDAPHWSEDGH